MEDLVMNPDFWRGKRVFMSTADAALHQMLGRGTGAARSIMEELLQRLCEHDNLAL